MEVVSEVGSSNADAVRAPGSASSTTNDQATKEQPVAEKASKLFCDLQDFKAAKQDAAKEEPVAKKASKLFGDLQEFKALLDKQGKDGDPALREQLGEVSNQLAAMFLESGRQAPGTPSSSSCCSSPAATTNAPAGTVRLHVDASMLRGSVGSFRDAQVDFQERQVVVRAVDRNGRTWTLRSAKLPGPINADESRFSLGKTGKDLSITLKKARADDIWHQEEMKFSEENIWSTGPDEGVKRNPKASGSGKAASDPGTSSRNKKDDAAVRDCMKLGYAFI